MAFTGRSCPTPATGERRGRQSVGQLWLKKPPVSTRRALSSIATVTLGGDSRKTLLVIRSMLPRVAKTSPAAKSTRRFASASSISERIHPPLPELWGLLYVRVTLKRELVLVIAGEPKPSQQRSTDSEVGRQRDDRGAGLMGKVRCGVAGPVIDNKDVDLLVEQALHDLRNAAGLIKRRHDGERSIVAAR